MYRRAKSVAYPGFFVVTQKHPPPHAMTFFNLPRSIIIIIKIKPASLLHHRNRYRTRQVCTQTETHSGIVAGALHFAGHKLFE